MVEVPPSTMSHPDEAGPSTVAATHPDVAGLSAAAMVQPDVATPNNIPSAEEACGTEEGLNVAVDEESPDEKSSLAVRFLQAMRK